MPPDLLAQVDALVPFTANLNQEMLHVSHLPKGNYQISIDGTPVLTCSAEELAQGINLATNAKTPQYKQALAVADLAAKHQSSDSFNRVISIGGTQIMVQQNIPLDDEEAGRKAVQAELDKRRAAHGSAPHLEVYLKYTQAQRKKMVEDAAALWDKVYTINKPVPHTYEIRLH
jgi:hypothetical protein